MVIRIRKEDRKVKRASRVSRDIKAKGYADSILIPKRYYPNSNKGIML